MQALACRISGWRGAQTLLSAALMLTAVPGAAMIKLPGAAPGAGPIVDGAAGPAGGDGRHPAGGLYDAVPTAADPFGSSATDGLTAYSVADPPFTAAASRRQAHPVASNNAELALLFSGGLGFVVASSLLRRRHRRRLGWGVLPERSLFGRDLCR